MVMVASRQWNRQLAGALVGRAYECEPHVDLAGLGLAGDRDFGGHHTRLVLQDRLACLSNRNLGQHFVVRRDTLITAGAILAGQDVQPMVF